MHIRSLENFHTDCAPEQSDGTQASWTSCSQAGCENMRGCSKCTPNNSDCGQLVSGAGETCVPTTCFAKCCVDEKQDLAQSSAEGNEESEMTIGLIIAIAALVIVAVMLVVVSKV